MLAAVRRRLFILLTLLVTAGAAGVWYAGFDAPGRPARAELGPFWVLALAADAAPARLAALAADLRARGIEPYGTYRRPLLAGQESGVLLAGEDALAVGSFARSRDYTFKRLTFGGLVVRYPDRGRLSRWVAERRALAALAPVADAGVDPLSRLVRVMDQDGLVYALAATETPGDFSSDARF